MPEALVVGTILVGRYTIAQVLEHGEGGNVYLANDAGPGEVPKAVKEIYDLWPDPQSKQWALQWLEWMAEVLVQVDHPAIPKLHDFFHTDDRKFVVMEYCEGETLASAVKGRGGPLGEGEVRQIGIQVCDALSALHAKGMVFGALSPLQVIRGLDGGIHLLDLGLARYYERSWRRESPQVPVKADFTPPEFYDPEGSLDPRTDVYGLGAVLHFLLSARPPGDFAPFSFPPLGQLNSAVSAAMESLVARALAPQPDDRFAGPADLAAALAEI